MDHLFHIEGEYFIPVSEISFSFARSSGPGGQAVNKSNTKVLLRWGLSGNESLPESVKLRFSTRYAHLINEAGEVCLQSQNARSQEQNRAECLRKLRALILSVLKPPKVRRKTKVPRRERARRLESKRRVGEKKRLRRSTE